MVIWWIQCCPIKAAKAARSLQNMFWKFLEILLEILEILETRSAPARQARNAFPEFPEFPETPIPGSTPSHADVLTIYITSKEDPTCPPPSSHLLLQPEGLSPVPHPTYPPPSSQSMELDARHKKGGLILASGKKAKVGFVLDRLVSEAESVSFGPRLSHPFPFIHVQHPW